MPLISNLGSRPDCQSGQPGFCISSSLTSHGGCTCELFFSSVPDGAAQAYLYETGNSLHPCLWLDTRHWLTKSVVPYVKDWFFFLPSLLYRGQASILLLGVTCFLSLSSWNPCINSSNDLSVYLNFSKNWVDKIVLHEQMITSWWTTDCS